MKRSSHIIRASLIVSLLIMHVSHTTTADELNWPQFRGPGGLGIAPDNHSFTGKQPTAGRLS